MQVLPGPWTAGMGFILPLLTFLSGQDLLTLPPHLPAMVLLSEPRAHHAGRLPLGFPASACASSQIPTQPQV